MGVADLVSDNEELLGTHRTRWLWHTPASQAMPSISRPRIPLYTRPIWGDRTTWAKPRLPTCPGLLVPGCGVDLSGRDHRAMGAPPVPEVANPHPISHDVLAACALPGWRNNCQCQK